MTANLQQNRIAKVIFVVVAAIFASISSNICAHSSEFREQLRIGDRLAGDYDSEFEFRGFWTVYPLYRCFEIDIPRGQTFEVVTYSDSYYEIVIRNSDDCEAKNWLYRKEVNHRSESRETFTSAGGRYTLQLRLQIRGGFRVALNNSATSSATYSLATGLPSLLPPAGTASGETSAPHGNRMGQIVRDCAYCPELVVIEPGNFMMGSPAGEVGRAAEEGPRHLVALPRPFAMGKYEVTFDEYDVCVAEGGCSYQVPDRSWGRGRRPVAVNYYDAQRYVGWLSEKTGRKYFLPSEAEWEYSARGGADTPWNTGDAILTEDANILGQFGKTVPVGGYPPNAFGLHDVHGNVAEWVQDCLDAGYVGAPSDGSVAASGDCSAKRIARGGSFLADPHATRSASRAFLPSASRSYATGFRVTRALE